jgi:hypothetical protein
VNGDRKNGLQLNRHTEIEQPPLSWGDSGPIGLESSGAAQLADCISCISVVLTILSKSATGQAVVLSGNGVARAKVQGKMRGETGRARLVGRARAFESRTFASAPCPGVGTSTCCGVRQHLAKPLVLSIGHSPREK